MAQSLTSGTGCTRVQRLRACSCVASSGAERVLLTSQQAVVASAQQDDGVASKAPDEAVADFVSKTAKTFAPRASGKQNPAFKGSALYTIFEVQSVVSIVVGGLLAFNILLPTDGPDIPRLIGMWSVWMFAVPSLRARDCAPREKDALNAAFVGIPLVNVALPFVVKSFSLAFSADCVLLAGLYLANGALEGFPDLPPQAEEPQK